MGRRSRGSGDCPGTKKKDWATEEPSREAEPTDLGSLAGRVFGDGAHKGKTFSQVYEDVAYVRWLRPRKESLRQRQFLLFLKYCDWRDANTGMNVDLVATQCTDVCVDAVCGPESVLSFVVDSGADCHVGPYSLREWSSRVTLFPRARTRNGRTWVVCCARQGDPCPCA